MSAASASVAGATDAKQALSAATTPAPAKGSAIRALSDDALLHVFSLLSVADLCHCAAACKSWNHLIGSVPDGEQQLWAPLLTASPWRLPPPLNALPPPTPKPVADTRAAALRGQPTPSPTSASIAPAQSARQQLKAQADVVRSASGRVAALASTDAAARHAAVQFFRANACAAIEQRLLLPSAAAGAPSSALQTALWVTREQRRLREWLEWANGADAAPWHAVERACLVLARNSPATPALADDACAAPLTALADRVRVALGLPKAYSAADIDAPIATPATATASSSSSSTSAAESDAKASSKTAAEVVAAIQEVMRAEGFRGAAGRQYYTAEASFLDCVLRTKIGIPISLAAVFLATFLRLIDPEAARHPRTRQLDPARLPAWLSAMRVAPMNTPGHFLLAAVALPAATATAMPATASKADTAAAAAASGVVEVEHPFDVSLSALPADTDVVYVDAFNGVAYAETDATDFFATEVGVELTPARLRHTQCTVAAMALRMVSNVLNVYRQSGDTAEAAIVLGAQHKALEVVLHLQQRFDGATPVAMALAAADGDADAARQYQLLHELIQNATLATQLLRRR